MPRILAAFILLCWVSSALSGDHRWVTGDALEPGLYVLAAPSTDQWPHPRPTALDNRPWFFRAGAIIRVYERRVVDGEPWYRTKWIKPRTIGDREDIHGWMKAADLIEHGAYVAW